MATLDSILDGASEALRDADAQLDAALDFGAGFVAGVGDGLGQGLQGVEGGALGIAAGGLPELYDDATGALDRAATAAEDTLRIMRWLPFIIIGSIVVLALAIVAAFAWRPGLARTLVSAITPGGLA